MSLMNLTAVQLGKKIKSGEVKVEDAVLDAFAQIEAVESDINSYVTVLEKEKVLAKGKGSSGKNRCRRAYRTFSRCACGNKGQHVYRRKS